MLSEPEAVATGQELKPWRQGCTEDKTLERTWSPSGMLLKGEREKEISLSFPTSSSHGVSHWPKLSGSQLARDSKKSNPKVGLWGAEQRSRRDLKANKHLPSTGCVLVTGVEKSKQTVTSHKAHELYKLSQCHMVKD